MRVKIDQKKTGEQIRSFMSENQLSYYKLEMLMGISVRSLCRWTSGATLPSIDNLLFLSVILGVPVETLIVFRFE